MSPILGIYASQISGHLWTPSGAYDSIATATVGAGGSTTIDFTSIPQGYKHLQLRTYHRQPVDKDLYLRINSDTSSNYSVHSLLTYGSTVYAGAVTNSSFVEWAYDGNQGNTDSFFVSIIDILDYSSTSKYKTMRLLYGTDANSSGLIELQSANWMSTSAITSINISTNGTSPNSLVQYSSFALYGIKGD